MTNPNQDLGPHSIIIIYLDKKENKIKKKNYIYIHMHTHISCVLDIETGFNQVSTVVVGLVTLQHVTVKRFSYFTLAISSSALSK